jgi:hypothetical protein
MTLDQPGMGVSSAHDQSIARVTRICFLGAVCSRSAAAGIPPPPARGRARQPRSTFTTLVTAGGLGLPGALLSNSPWIYRVITERLTLYRTGVEWSRESETLGEWTYTRAGCFSQATRRRHKSLSRTAGPHRRWSKSNAFEVARGGSGSAQHGGA